MLAGETSIKVDRKESMLKSKNSKYTKGEKLNKIYSHFWIVRVYIKKVS